MKKQLLILLLGCAVCFFSCSKDNIQEPTLDKTTETAARLANMTSFVIPPQYMEDPHYQGPIRTEIIQETVTLNEVTYNVNIEVEYTDNDKLVYIGASTDWVVAMNLPHDMFVGAIAQDFGHAMDLGGPATSASCSGFWKKVGEFFIGKKECTPCSVGYRTCCYYHWSGIVHSCKTSPC